MRFGFKFVMLAAVSALAGLAGNSHAQGPQLFSNQYTQGASDQATAVMYLAPVPVPANVGHTYYTYQPLYPHEFMHIHKERYHNYYDQGRGLNRTGVHYWAPPVRIGAVSLWKTISLPR